MDIRKLQRLIVDAIDDLKGQDVRVFDTTRLSDIFDRVVVASGSSNRQTRSLADSVVQKVKEAGGHVLSVEGEDTGEWVLVDLGDAVVHLMLPPIRAYYDLEELWGGKPVRVALTTPAPARKRAGDGAAAGTRTRAAADRPEGSAAKRAAKSSAAGKKSAKKSGTAAQRPAAGAAAARPSRTAAKRAGTSAAPAAGKTPRRRTAASG